MFICKQDAARRNRVFWFAVVLAIAARIAVFGFAAQSAIAVQNGNPTSLIQFQLGSDIQFYLRSARAYRKLPFTQISCLPAGLESVLSSCIKSFLEYYDFRNIESTDPARPGTYRSRSVIGDNVDYFLAPPVLPALLIAFDYRDGNPIPFGAFYLLLSCVLVALWLRWLWAQGLATPWLVVFALVPNPIWFTISISTDLVFALVFAAFYLFYFSPQRNRWRIGLWMLFLALTVLTRPNGVSFLLFVVADGIFFATQSVRINRVVLAALVAPILAAVIFFFAPHLNVYIFHGMDISYFGVAQHEFLSGIYESWPIWFDRPMSWLSLLGAKVVYLVGLRPSYDQVPLAFLILRASVGLVLLPGLIYLFLRADWRIRFLVALYLLPIFLGASQDRYNLPIQPILFFYGVLAFHEMWGRWAGGSATVEAQPVSRDARLDGPARRIE